MRRTIYLAYLLGLLLLYIGCATVPLTGRNQLMLISPRTERKLGMTLYDKFKKAAAQKGVIVSRTENEASAKLYAGTNRVLMKLGIAAQLLTGNTLLDWPQFLITRSSEANAAVLPGNRIIIHGGLFLEMVQSEQDLATVLSHEIAHVIARHGAEQLSQEILISAIGESMEAAVRSGRAAKYADLIVAAYGLTTHLGISLPFSREQELEADRMGMLLMAKAGYDPAHAVRFWRRTMEKEGGGRFDFFSTHPSHEKRMEALEAALPEAQKLYLTGEWEPPPRPTPDARSEENSAE